MDFEDLLVGAIDYKRQTFDRYEKGFSYYVVGLPGLRLDFEEWASACFGDRWDLIDKAVPSDETILTKRAAGIIATQPADDGDPRFKWTYVDSGAQAFIKPNWRYAGDKDFAENFWGMSESSWEKEKPNHCKPDRWNGIDWYDPATYYPAKMAFKNTKAGD